MSANENQDGLTAQQRLEDWNSFCVKFYRHLTDRPGTILPAAWRLAIVVAAQEALDCKGCQSAGASTCLRPGSAFGFISSLDHQPVLQGLDDAPENAKTVVRNLVVTIVNHQTKVDEKWYDQTIDALDKHTHLIPSSIVGENRRGMLGTLFAEILGLTIVSHGIDLSYRAIERSPPPMPRIEDVQQLALEPTMWNIAKSLKKGKELRREKQGAGWAPLLEYGDLDKSSIADMFAPDQINFLKKRMVAMLPFAVLNMSPHDLLIEYDYFDTFAYDQKRSHGGVFLGASKRYAHTDSHRQDLLVELGTAVATRPFDEKRFLAACHSIRESLDEGSLMEAIGMAAAMDGTTRCVDISGKDPPPAAMLKFLSWILNSMNWICS